MINHINKIFRNRQGQHIAEFMVLFLAVCIAFVGTRLYLRRGINAKLKLVEDRVNEAMNIDPTNFLVAQLLSCGGAAGNFSGSIIVPSAYQQNFINSDTVYMTMTSDEWRTLSGATLSPGNYVYWFSIPGKWCCFSCKPCRQRMCRINGVHLTITS